MNAQSIFNNKFLVNFTKYTFLLTELTKRDIKIKYRRSILGIFWSFLEPLLFMIVLTIIFSTLFKGNIANYPVYLLTGRLVYSFFGQGTQGSLHSIYKNASIIKKIYVPKYMYGLSVSSFKFNNILIIVYCPFYGDDSYTCAFHMVYSTCNSSTYTSILLYYRCWSYTGHINSIL